MDKTKQVKMLRGAVTGTNKHAAEGEVVELAAETALYFINAGIAEAYQPPKRGRPKK